jgi:GNAT superfamily N-acetyltransferase
LSHPIMTDIGNIKEIKEQYNHIAPICISIKEKMQVDLKELLDGFQFIDSVTGRVKEKNSFITKIGGIRILNVNRYLITHGVVVNRSRPEIPTLSEIQNIYPRFDSKQISELITENRIFCLRSSSNEIAGLVIITRRNSLLSEISIRTMPNFLRQGYGLKILEQAIQHEIDLGLIVVFVTEQENLAANALINKFIPDRQYQERMVIN